MSKFTRGKWFEENYYDVFSDNGHEDVYIGALSGASYDEVKANARAILDKEAACTDRRHGGPVMKDLMKDKWKYFKNTDGAFIVTAPDRLIAQTFTSRFLSCSETMQEAEFNTQNEAIARAVSYLPEMYSAIEEAAKKCELCAVYDDDEELFNEAVYLRNLLARIDGELHDEGVYLCDLEELEAKS